MANPFKNWTGKDVADLVDEFPLALLITGSGEDPVVSPLPMLVDRDSRGNPVRLVGHMALRNPQVEQLRHHPRAMFTFLGPNSYISPRLVSKKGWGPTWNYAVAWIEADVTLVPEKNHQALQRLVRHLEGEGQSAWTTEEMGDRYGQLSQYIIAFDAEIRSVSAKFKLGQDEDPAAFGEILRGLEVPELAEWMQRFSTPK